jgi:hypothetical protein
MQNPDLYIADITIRATTKVRGNKTESNEYKLPLYPLLLINGELASSVELRKIGKRVWKDLIGKKAFDDFTFRVIKIENIKFSSKINYTYEKE